MIYLSKFFRLISTQNPLDVSWINDYTLIFFTKLFAILTLQLDRREHDDPCPYLLAIWTPGMRQALKMKYIFYRLKNYCFVCTLKYCFVSVNNIWHPITGETAQSIQPPEMGCTSEKSGKLCDKNTCFTCNSIREASAQTVRGTLLVRNNHG